LIAAICGCSACIFFDDFMLEKRSGKSTILMPIVTTTMAQPKFSLVTCLAVQVRTKNSGLAMNPNQNVEISVSSRPLEGIGAGITTVLVMRNSLVPTIGASGAIFGILIANAILFPDRRIWLFPLPLAIPMRPFVAVMGAIEFFSTLGETGDRVSHLCHLGGMLIGWLYLRRGSFLYRVRNEMADWKYQRNKKKFQVYMKKQKDEPPSRPDQWVN